MLATKLSTVPSRATASRKGGKWLLWVGKRHAREAGSKRAARSAEARLAWTLRASETRRDQVAPKPSREEVRGLRGLQAARGIGYKEAAGANSRGPRPVWRAEARCFARQG